MTYKYRFTIFTPCYNSEKFINRVFDSLESQVFKDFEWLVINDASTDNTGKILDEYASKAVFPVRVIHNDHNKMLYYNYNLAFNEAQGELMVFAGHDDRFNLQTLEIFDDIWKKYGSNEISGIWCLCQDQNGKPIGKNFPQEVLISNYFEIFEDYIYRQERFGCTRTDILRRFPFEIDNDRVGEMFLWEAIGTKYKTIYLNKVLRTYYIEPDNKMALTKLPRIKLSTPIYLSYRDWINNYLNAYKFSILFRLRYHFAFVFYGLLTTRPITKILSEIRKTKSKLIVLLFYPLAVLVKLYLGSRGKL